MNFFIDLVKIVKNCNNLIFLDNGLIFVHSFFQAYHSQYNMISSGWVDQGVPYDPESIMHYPYYGFLTQEASNAGLSAMTDKETGRYLGYSNQKTKF